MTTISARVWDDLQALDLEHWRPALEDVLRERQSDAAHGDMPRWRAAVAGLPAVHVAGAALDRDIVALPAEPLSSAGQQDIREQLLQLCPWRKGPFNIGGVHIDTEWRSDLKWRRVQDAISPLADRRVLDVGCGNGYYALRMLGAGARCVIGIDPTLLFVMQFAALQRFMPELPVHVLPLRCEELPAGTPAFDTVFSMGVLYHRRTPLEHLRELRDQLVSDGELVLETLVLPGSEPLAWTPPDRYARMRNVWLLPTVAELTTWLERGGFRDVRCADLTQTSVTEQRTTEWMPFESLADALDPNDPDRTIEGWPAPLRAILIARKP